jgi:hypothetical protein
MKSETGLLDDMAPQPKKFVKRKKKFHSTKGASLDILLRRQVTVEMDTEEPNKDTRYSLFQKYGIVTPKIDRLATKPFFMSEAEWKRKQNEFYQMTKGLVAPQQQKRSFRPTYPSSTPQPSPRTNNPKGRTYPSPVKGTTTFRPNYDQTPTATRQN